jgi:hypothetical protein
MAEAEADAIAKAIAKAKAKAKEKEENIAMRLIEYEQQVVAFEKTYNCKIDEDDDFRIDEYYEKPIFAFLGDTDHRVFNDDIVFDYPVIFVECSFLGDPDGSLTDQARHRKHIIWKNIMPIIKAHPDNLFVLYHFSARYTSSDIRAFFAKYQIKGNKSYIPNIHPWVIPE